MSDIRRLWFFVATWQQQAFLWVCNVYICNSNVETKVLFSTCTASNEGLDVWWWMRNKVMSQHSLYRWSRHPILSRLPFLSTRTWGSISVKIILQMCMLMFLWTKTAVWARGVTMQHLVSPCSIWCHHAARVRFLYSAKTYHMISLEIKRWSNGMSQQEGCLQAIYKWWLWWTRSIPLCPPHV